MNKQNKNKRMLRVLLSTLLPVVLSITCLVSTTWAWYTASIVSEGNVIKLGQWTPPAETTQETTEETTAEETTEPTEETTEETTTGEGQ